jgi:hypothetical protein
LKRKRDRILADIEDGQQRKIKNNCFKSSIKSSKYLAVIMEVLMSLEILKEAIKKRLPIEFEYNKEGKIPGLRKGNPHAVFIMRKKDGSESTKVHVVQTSGVSDSG